MNSKIMEFYCILVIQSVSSHCTNFFPKFLNEARAFCLTRSATSHSSFDSSLKRALKWDIKHPDQLSAEVRRSSEKNHLSKKSIFSWYENVGLHVGQYKMNLLLWVRAYNLKGIKTWFRPTSGFGFLHILYHKDHEPPLITMNFSRLNEKFFISE